MLEIQIFGGGAHAGRRVDVQDFMVIPVAARTFDEALAMTAEVYRAAGSLMADAGKLHGVADEGGHWPAFDTNEEALEMLVRAIERARFTPGADVAISLDIAAAGSRVQIIGDDYLVTDARRVKEAIGSRACNAVLIKPNQAGTITAARAALDAAKAAGWGTIVSARSGETEDVTIVHLATGWDAGQLKVGSFARSERMAKWNEGPRIEEALGAGARLAPFP